MDTSPQPVADAARAARGAGDSAAAVIARALRAHGVIRLFTLCGGHIMPIHMAAHALGTHIVDVRDERAAVYMAHAHAELTGEPGEAVARATGQGGDPGPVHLDFPTDVLRATIPRLQFADHAAMALAFGMHGQRVERVEDLDGAITTALQHLPALLDVVVSTQARSSDSRSGLAWVPDLQAVEAWDLAERQWRAPS